MAYTHDGYTLFTKEIEWGPKSNKSKRNIYFFSKKLPKSGTPVDELPEGMKVKVNLKTGLPVLARINPDPKRIARKKARKEQKRRARAERSKKRKKERRKARRAAKKAERN